MNGLFNNKYNNRAFWGTVIGTSLGVIISSQMTPKSRRRMMKTARRAKNTVKDGMNTLWK